MRKLGVSFVAFNFIVLTVYSTFGPMYANLNLLIQSKFEFDTVETGRIVVSSLRPANPLIRL